MKKIYRKALTFITVISLIISCNEAAETPKGEFAEGIYIINEGNFSDANGSVSFFNESTSETVQDVFAEANGIAVGGLIQSVYFHEGQAFVIDNLGSKIYVVDAETFELINTIESGLNAPRYMTVLDGKAYVTNWGAYDQNWNLPDSYVSVIDLETLEQTASVATDEGCEGVFAHGGQIYVANSFSNSVEVINPGTKSVTSQIEVEWGPRSFVEDKNGEIWLLSSAFIGPSYLSVLDLGIDEVKKSISIAPYAKSLSINGTGDTLYYLSSPFGEDAGVFRQLVDSNEAETVPIISAANLYGLGVHPETGDLYLANNNGFQGNGTALIYEFDQLKSSFSTGIGPNGFVFR